MLGCDENADKRLVRAQGAGECERLECCSVVVWRSIESQTTLPQHGVGPGRVWVGATDAVTRGWLRRKGRALEV